MLVGNGYFDTLIGQGTVDIKELRRHISHKRIPKERNKRFTSAEYVLMTLKSPHEIWVNGDNSLSYVSIRVGSRIMHA